MSVEHMVNDLYDHRIKKNTDYAIVTKYGQTHLLCADVFLPTIQEEAIKHGVTFTTIHTYPAFLTNG